VLTVVRALDTLGRTFRRLLHRTVWTLFPQCLVLFIYTVLGDSSVSLMRFSALALLLLALGGCSSLQLSGRGLDAYEAQARGYLLCGMVNGRRIGLAQPTEDPLYLAIAVERDCVEEQVALADAIMAHERSAVWQRRLDMHERGFLEAVIAEIIDARS
jgi:hypothetical protein